MDITVKVLDEDVQRMVQERANELFAPHSTYNDAPLRRQLREVMDTELARVFAGALPAVTADLPALAEAALRDAFVKSIERMAKDHARSLRKQFAGFDPASLTPEKRRWVSEQIAKMHTQTAEVTP